MNKITAFRAIASLAAAIVCGQGASAQTKEPITLMFWGDMMQHDTQIWAAEDSTNKGHYDYTACFANVKKEIAAADIAVCNFECTLAGKPYKGYPCFSAPDEYFEAMVESGFDLFLTANNHCLDKGKLGLEKTIEKMQNRGVRQEGTYKDAQDKANRYPVIMEVRGVRIALLAYTYGTNGLKVSAPNVVNYTDTAVIRKDIETSRKMGADYVIANMHWGIEYEHTPRVEQKQLAHWLIDNGVDHVIGGHPHVVQPAEIYKGKDGREHFVIYSLGNVLSNTQQEGGDGGIVVTLRLPADGTYTTPDVTYSIFHVARPAWADVPNFIIFPEGFEGDVPEGEREKMRNFVETTRRVMSQGTEIRETKLRDAL